MSQLVSKVPLRVITNPNVPLMGAARVGMMELARAEEEERPPPPTTSFRGVRK
jgi:hypothetical protein